MIIGVMGGVGSGKSTVLSYLEEKYNALIIQSDKVAKEIMLPGNLVFEKIKKNFPKVIKDNKIDSNLLALEVFGNKDKLEILNSITHPATINEIRKRMKQSDKSIIVIESAILLGTGLENDCNQLWYVYCNNDTRIERLMNSRGYSREKCLSVINNQPSEESYKLASDVVIDNSFSQENTKEQINKILSAN